VVRVSFRSWRLIKRRGRDSRASSCHPERAAAFAANEGPKSAKPTLPPPGIFPTCVANKALAQIDPCATLGRRLGGPWATLGPPKGHPIPDPIPIGRGSQLKAPCFAAYAVGFFWQKLRANSQKPNCQISFPARTLGRCQTIARFAVRINSEKGRAELLVGPLKCALCAHQSRAPGQCSPGQSGLIFYRTCQLSDGSNRADYQRNRGSGNSMARVEQPPSAVRIKNNCGAQAPSPADDGLSNRKPGANSTQDTQLRASENVWQ
jgi:hypothetical protein